MQGERKDREEGDLYIYIYIYSSLDPLRRKIRLDSAFEWVDEKGAKAGAIL